jgi:hypothetical protein
MGCSGGDVGREEGRRLGIVTRIEDLLDGMRCEFGGTRSGQRARTRLRLREGSRGIRMWEGGEEFEVRKERLKDDVWPRRVDGFVWKMRSLRRE